jgi:hypothetical protein
LLPCLITGLVYLALYTASVQATSSTNNLGVIPMYILA